MSDVNQPLESPARADAPTSHVSYFVENAQVTVRRNVPGWVRVMFGVFGALGVIAGGALLLVVAENGQPLLYAEALLAMLGCASALAGAIAL